MADFGEGGPDERFERSRNISAAIAASNSRYRARKAKELDTINQVRKSRGQRLLSLEEFMAMNAKPVTSSGAPGRHLYNIAKMEAARESERAAMGHAAMERVFAHENAAKAQRFAKNTRESAVAAAAAAEKASEAAKKAVEHLAGAPDVEAVKAAAAMAAEEAIKAAEASAVASRAAAAAERFAAQAAEAAKETKVDETALAAAKAESADLDAGRRAAVAVAAAAAAEEAAREASAARRVAMELAKKETAAAGIDPAKMVRYRALLEEFKGEFIKSTDKTIKSKATVIDNALKAGSMPALSLFTKKQKERIRAANLANVAGLNTATGGARRTHRRRRH
jgi:hypothetical protein